MVLKFIKTLIALVLLLNLAMPAMAAGLVDDVAVGIRWKQFELTGDKNFTGTITADVVDEKTELYPTNFNVLVTFCPYGGVVFEYDHFGAVMDNDGRLFWDTFMLGVTVRHHFKKLRIAPYAVAGLTWNWVRFDENNWWRYGYGSPKEFDDYSAGKTPDDWKNATGRRRNMKTDNSFGWAVGFGLDLFLTEHLALNLDVHWNFADTDVNYSNVSRGTTFIDRDFTYSLDTVAYGVGLRWYF
jgi:opacity protein-like surface antigen